MQLLIGLVLGLVFFICLGLSFYAGYKLGSKMKKALSGTEDDLKEKQKRRLMLQGMQNILSYDYQKALGVKHE